MLLQQKTIDELGYDPINLSSGSNKTVYVRCDYCNFEFTNTMKKFNRGRKIVKKDSCNECKFKKREDVSLARDGVKNSAQRQEVRDKIRDANIKRLQSEEYKKLVKETNLKNFGVESVMDSKEFKDKLKNIFMEKYGVDNPSKNKEIKDRATKSMIKTMVDKYRKEK